MPGPALAGESVGVVVGLSGLHGEDDEARALGETLKAYKGRLVGATGVEALRPARGLEEGPALVLVVDAGQVGPPVEVAGQALAEDDAGELLELLRGELGEVGASWAIRRARSSTAIAPAAVTFSSMVCMSSPLVSICLII